jgi:hypothetical protein
MAIVSDIEIRLAANIAQLRQDMDQARQAVGGAMNGIRDSVNTATKALGALAVGMAAGAFAGWIKGAIDATDAVSDISQRTGIAIKDIAGLQMWFQKGGTEAGAFEGAMIKLSKKIADGGKEFDRLGIKTRDANGNLRTNVDVLRDSADAFAAMQDGTAKTALAVELFGKSGAELIPLLNEGSEGLREMNEMAEKLGLTFDEKTVNAAGDFNDTLDLMGAASQGVARQVAAQLLPTLNSLTGSMLQFITTGDKVRGAADVIGTGFKLIYTAGMLITQVFNVAGKTIGMLGAQLVALFQLEFKQAMNIGHAWQADMKDVFTSTAKTIGDVWTGAGGEVVQALVTSTNAGTVAANTTSKDAKRQADAYQGLIDAIQGKISESDREAAGLAKLTESQKLAMSLDKALAEGKVTLTAAEEGYYRMLIEVLGASEDTARVNKEIEESNKRAAKGADDLAKFMKQIAAERDKDVETAIKEADAQEELVRTFGMTKTALAELAVVRAQDNLERAKTEGLDYDEMERLRKIVDEKKRAAAATQQLEGLEEAKKASDELNKFFDESKAETFGDTLAKAFGRAGSAMGQLTSTFQSYANKQSSFEKQRGNAALKYLNNLSDEKEYTRDLQNIDRDRFSAQLGGYGDMAGAAAGFFGEQSKGYKILSSVSQAFHAAELAATIAGLVPKGIAAILTQGQGDPYTAFPRMAAMAAFVATLGVSVSGGGAGSASVSKQRQATQGTGSVLGDSSAKSESLANALKMVADNTYRNLSVNYDMLSALRSIESNLSGLGNLIVRGTGITDLASSVSGTSSGGFWGGMMKSIFGGKVSVLDTGIKIDPTSLAAAMAGGINAMSYVDTKKSGGWFSSDKFRTQTEGLGAEVNTQFGKVIASLAEGVKASASVLGMVGDEFNQKLSGFVVDIGLISLKDLKGEEIQAELEAAFSKLGDDIANYAIAGLSEFQKVGEGTYETLVRIANNYATVDAVLNSFGKTFGAVGMASVAARESLIELAGGLDDFTSQGSFFLENFFSDAEKEATLRTAVYAQLDKVAGGSSAQTVAQFKALVLAQDLTTQSGREAYASLMSASQAFIDLAKYTDEAAEKARELASQRRDLEIQIMEMEGKAIEALAAQRQMELAAVDVSLRPLYERIYALQDEAAATEAAANAVALLQSTAGAMFNELRRSVDAERSGVQESFNKLMAGIQASIDTTTAKITDLQALSAALRGANVAGVSDMQSSSRRAAADAQITAALAIARASGVLPKADDLKDALAAVAIDTADQFSSMADYQRAQLRTQNSIEELAGITDTELSVAQRTLIALQDQKTAAQSMFNAQMEKYDEMLTKAQQQLDAINGIGQVQPLIDAFNNFAASIAGALQNPTIGGQPSVTGQTQIEALYNSVLGRTSDAAGLSYYLDLLKNGASLANIEQDIRNSAEYAARTGSIYNPQQSGTMSAASGDQAAINQRMEENTARTAAAIEQLAQQFNQVSAGGNSLAVETV